MADTQKVEKEPAVQPAPAPKAAPAATAPEAASTDKASQQGAPSEPAAPKRFGSHPGHIGTATANVSMMFGRAMLSYRAGQRIAADDAQYDGLTKAHAPIAWDE